MDLKVTIPAGSTHLRCCQIVWRKRWQPADWSRHWTQVSLIWNPPKRLSLFKARNRKWRMLKGEQGSVTRFWRLKLLMFQLLVNSDLTPVKLLSMSKHEVFVQRRLILLTLSRSPQLQSTSDPDQPQPKKPPLFDGPTSWFKYEELIDDWLDLTVLEAGERGPALENRLIGDAAMYRTSWPRISVIRRCSQVFQGYVETPLHQRNSECFPLEVLSMKNGQREETWSWSNGSASSHCSWSVYGLRGRTCCRCPPPTEQKTARGRLLPFCDNSSTLMCIVACGLSEARRERLTSSLSLQGVNVTAYTFEALRTVFVELFCSPESWIENPSLRVYRHGGSTSRTFIVEDFVEDEFGQ